MFLLFVSSELKYFVEKKITVSDSQLYHLDLQIWSICMGTGVNPSPLIPEHMTCFMQMGSSHISLQRGAIWWIYFWRWIEFYALRYFFCVPFVYYPTAYSWTLCCSLQSCLLWSFAPCSRYCFTAVNNPPSLYFDIWDMCLVTRDGLLFLINWEL